MKPKRVAVLVLLAILAALMLVQTQWFGERVRERIIAAVEQATGGRIEMNRFSFDWHTLTATFTDFVVHGTEPASSRPLFRAPSVRIQFRFTSALKRKVAVSSVIVERPDVYILFRPDGSTNIPRPRTAYANSSAILQNVLNLQLGHCELNHGTLQIDLRVVPLNVQSNDTHILLAYNRRKPEYLLTIASQNVHLRTSVRPILATELYARARIRNDAVTLENAEIASAASTLHASGTIRDFLRPVLHLNITAELDAAEVARQAGLSNLQSGRVLISGALQTDGTTPVQFSGDLSAHDLAFQVGHYAFRNCSSSSRVVILPQSVRFSDVKLLTPFAQLSGEATIRDGHFSLAGHISGANVRRSLQMALHRNVPWTGNVGGRVSVSGIVGKLSTIVVEAKLDITPEPGTPISGHIEASYRQVGPSLDLANSELSLTHTHAAFSGRLNQILYVALDTSDTNELRPFIVAPLPAFAAEGNAHFEGLITGPLGNPVLDGVLAVNHFATAGITWNRLHTYARVSSSLADFRDMSVEGSAADLSGDAHLPLVRWALNPQGATWMNLRIQRADLNRLAPLLHIGNFGLQRGLLSGNLNLHGPFNDPQGSAHFTLREGVLYGQQIDRGAADITLSSGELRVLHAKAAAGSAALAFSGSYIHLQSSWSTGELRIKADSNAFPLHTLAAARNYQPAWDAEVEIHGDAGIGIKQGHVQPAATNGTLVLRHITEHNQPLGAVTVDASTRAGFLYAGFSGDLASSHWKGNAEIELAPGSPINGRLQVDHAQLRAIYDLFTSYPAELPVDGSLGGAATFKGLLAHPESIQASIQIGSLEVSEGKLAGGVASARPLIFRNSEPMLLDIAGARLGVRNCHLSGPDTNFAISGSVGLLQQNALDLRAEGAVDLKLIQLVQPALQTGGRALMSASIAGTAAAPTFDGSLQIQNGSLLAAGFSNELTSVNGLVRFTRNHATIQNLTARTGGGSISAGGFVEFANGARPVYRLDASAQNVRIRYANTISITANSQFRFAGTSNNGVLSGSATVSRVVFTPNADVGTLLASAFAPAASVTPENDLLTGLQLDVRIQSAPDLEVTTQLSRDLQAEIDLRLRGTPQHPILLGDIVANQGDIRIFGGKYSINHGEIQFVNAARIVPVLDLELQTVARGITVDVTIAGTPGKLNINYRSDPPLQPRDIIALLAVGRVPITGAVNSNLQTTTDSTATQLTGNSVLGQAISPPPSGLQKLFGVTNVRIDPSLLQGITNVPQARLTLEQQISREITVTYVTNLSQTAEQIFRVEWAFSPQYSVVALRDDNGEFGIDIQYRKRFK